VRPILNSFCMIFSSSSPSNVALLNRGKQEISFHCGEVTMTYTKSSQHQTNGIRLFVYFLLALVLLIGFFDHRLSTIQLIAGCSLLVTELILNSNVGHQLVSQYPFLRMIPRLNVFFICIYPLLPSQSSISLGTILDILGCLLIFLLAFPLHDRLLSSTLYKFRKKRA
jgi:hypothetical protein